ncbi:phospho-N-acetylmuramoyl-pentapeptide-transferase [Candidatus Uhrbacteria bacterium CG10_big_fil_rev_8_21_14_0_10_50_16]|uniref:Phospho-N-acetylmuramoyl-pentapeptide-transferase n=1 Tax=Candidatus Uhrbacteria bacterium CG10_big_fil_rev_8_21_14_0_10_50_16 TaxID=1975039 RepID=A0A2H0RN16_9BACT|nr:MAG: phospho-N-acetylmuramoyl-pentapeptide-transferase [Candidatus Uhrbacteria bacterium CG10_big_fil_rev_8_21_14_0_10_50_16]
MPSMESFQVIRLILLAALTFVVAIAWTPLLTNVLYRLKIGKTIRTASITPIFAKLHAKKAGTPTMGGVLIWGTVLAVSSVLLIVRLVAPDSLVGHLSFLTRSQTLLPLGAFVASALVGLVDDWMNVKKIGPHGGGLSMKYRLGIYTIIAAIGSWWFYTKLDWDLFHVPFVGDFAVGWWYIPIFIFVIVATSFSVNETDGLDGLAGGTLMTSFGAYGAIALAQGRFELAAFCIAIVGALLAFLWFNIYPARFFMGDTGSMALGVTLGVVAMLTNMALLLPLIGIVLVLESLSVIVQLTSKKLRKGKKIFLSTPIHHHFEAIGWPEPKIVMRAWVISIVASTLGVAVALLDMGLF